jgi:hypothetical protein
MDQPAQTTGYMIAGYIVIFGALISYVVSLIVRWKKLSDEKKYLEEI